MAKIVCPRCGQDYVENGLIKPPNVPVFICMECEATWRVGTPILLETFTDLTTLLNSLGIAYTEYDKWEAFGPVDDGTG